MYIYKSYQFDETFFFCENIHKKYYLQDNLQGKFGNVVSAHKGGSPFKCHPDENQGLSMLVCPARV